MIAFKIFMAIETTLCYIPGILLRYTPFKAIVTKKQKRTLLITYIIMLLVNILVLGAIQLFVIDDVSNSSWLTKSDYNIFGLLSILVNMLIIPGHTKEHLFTYGVVVTCRYMKLSVSTLIAVQFESLNVVSQYMMGTIIFIILQIVMYFPIKNILNKTVSPFLFIDCGDYWKRVWFIPITMYYSMFFSLSINENINDINQLVSRLLVSFATVFLCYIVAADHKLLMEKQQLSEQLDISKVHYASLQAKVAQARKTNHDLKHMISSIRYYIETDDKSGLRSFCDDIEENQLAHNNIPYTGNAAADGVIYHYILKAEENHIEFTYTGIIDSKGILDLDLCVLLGNALDNALTGSITASDERSITVVAQSEAETLSVIVQNTFDGKVEIGQDTLLSRKRENSEGIGLTSMQSVCEKYGGTMETKWDDHTFTVLFVLTRS